MEDRPVVLDDTTKTTKADVLNLAASLTEIQKALEKKNAGTKGTSRGERRTGKRKGREVSNK